MTISIFSSKKTWSPRSKELVRTDVGSMEEANKKMDELLKSGHELNGFVTNYDVPAPRQRRRNG